MSLDIRIPIGLMFSIYGVLLAAYGAAGTPCVTAHSTTNTPYAADHIQACWCVVNTGSNSTG